MQSKFSLILPFAVMCLILWSKQIQSAARITKESQSNEVGRMRSISDMMSWHVTSQEEAKRSA